MFSSRFNRGQKSCTTVEAATHDADLGPDDEDQNVETRIDKQTATLDLLWTAWYSKVHGFTERSASRTLVLFKTAAIEWSDGTQSQGN